MDIKFLLNTLDHIDWELVETVDSLGIHHIANAKEKIVTDDIVSVKIIRDSDTTILFDNKTA